MSTREPSWELYETFLAVLDGGSLSAAARTLAVAQPTVRRRLEVLEEHLGAVLFTRAPNGLTPTELALATRPDAEAMAASARALVRSVSARRDEPRGTVRVTCSEVMGSEVLPELLAPLLRAHRGLQLELSISNRAQDLLRRDADIAVRMFAPTQRALVARRIGAIPVGLFARTEYLARHGAPRRASQLLEHTLVGADRGRVMLDALSSLSVEATPRNFTFRTDSDIAQLAAIRAGVGIGACQVAIAAREPRLVRVLPSISFPLETWVVMHEDQRRVRRIRLVFDHLVATVGEYARATQPRRRSKPA